MKILWTEPAVQDLQAIRDYIAVDSEYYAAGLIEKLLTRSMCLKTFPTSDAWFLKANLRMFANLLFMDID